MTGVSTGVMMVQQTLLATGIIGGSMRLDVGEITALWKVAMARKWEAHVQRASFFPAAERILPMATKARP